MSIYLDPQDNGVNVQLGVDNGDTVLETFSYPEGEKPIGWSFVSLDEGEKTSLPLGNEQIIFAMALDFGDGVKSYSCDALSTDKKMVEDTAYMIVIRAFLTNSDNSIDVPKVIETEPDSGEPAPEEPDVSTLSEEQTAIRQAILGHNKSPYPQEYDVACCSFITLETLSGTPLAGSNTHKITYYGWALYEEYRVTDNGLDTVSGSHVPVALSFDLDERGYTLTEYWEPRDGSYYAPDIQEKFPSHIAEDALNNQQFILQQMQECYEQAIASTGLDTDKVIEALIETICCSPALSSNPGDYIQEHSIEYRELTYYGQYTLKYCFARFEEGGETGLNGQIMARVCEDIAVSWGEDGLRLLVCETPADGVITGQMWYNALKNNALNLMAQYTEIELAERYPASYLLLSMHGEV